MQQTENIQVSSKINKKRRTENPIPASNESFSEISSCDDEKNENTEEYIPPLEWEKGPKKMKILSEDLLTALDRTKLSSSKGMMVIAPTLKAVGINLKEVTLSRSSIQRSREKCREEIDVKLRSDFLYEPPYTLHWDGKIVKNKNQGSEERLAITVSGGPGEHILKIPQVVNGTSEMAVSAILNALQEFFLCDKIQAFVFDTTAVNSGEKGGVCITLLKVLERDVLVFGCKHHVLELVLKSVYEFHMGKSTSPDVSLFKDFQKQWMNIDQEKYDCTIIVSEDFARYINSRKSWILSFIDFTLKV